LSLGLEPQSVMRGRQHILVFENDDEDELDGYGYDVKTDEGG
jgi:hypothetical protein